MSRLVPLLLALLPWVLPGEDPPPSPRTNVLFLIVDDLRADLGCYGVEGTVSPHIDRLAAAGLRLDRAYCQQALCSPSRTSVLTGLRPDSTGVYNLERHFRQSVPDVVTLPQRFAQAGWTSIGLGKVYHDARLEDPRSWSEPWREPERWIYQDPATRERVQAKRARLEQGGRAALTPNGPPTERFDAPEDAYYDGALAAMAIERMEELARGGEPFFLAVGFKRPHLPFVAPARYWDLHDPDTLELAADREPPRDAPAWAVNSWIELRRYEGIPREGPLDDARARELIHGYRACTSFVDAQVGRVLDALERLELDERTVVVLWSDHGWKLGEHGAWCKHTNFELDTRAPLLVRAPGVTRPGTATSGMVELVDLYPTLCELAGIEPPPHLEGTSFAPLLREPDRPWKPAVFSQYLRGTPAGKVMGYSMRTERYRYTRWVDPAEPERVLGVELYDHRRDPGESVNFAPTVRSDRLLERLDEQLDAGWRAAVPASSSDD